MSERGKPVITCEANILLRRLGNSDALAANCKRCSFNDVKVGFGSDTVGGGMYRTKYFLKLECKKWKKTGSGEMPDSFLPLQLQS